MPTWNEIMRPPECPVSAGVERVTVRLGEDTYNTCNPGVGDVDGDGLDELAVPVIEGDACRICLYKGDGREVWRNEDVRFFNFFYGDMAANRGTHWHARSRHRHLFTRIFDIDGDGALEVVCGDGPVWVLDGRTGAVKTMIDLDAHVQAWCPARLDGPDGSPSFVGGIERRDGGGSAIVAIDRTLQVRWTSAVEGRSFEDAVWAGDVDRDGRDEIVFSPATTKAMFLVGAGGRVRWRRPIHGVIGDDTHVDDCVIAPVLPGSDRQILMATGPALLDRDGEIIWTRGETYDHAQRVLAVPAGGEDAPCTVYFCESYARRSYMLDHAGRPLWVFAGYQAPRPEFAARVRPRLTTAGGIADWFGDGSTVIVQGEVVCVPRSEPDLVEGDGLFNVMLFSPSGEVVGCLAFTDACDGWGGAMCAVPGRFTSPEADGIAVIAHSSSGLHFFSRAEAYGVRHLGGA